MDPDCDLVAEARGLVADVRAAVSHHESFLAGVKAGAPRDAVVPYDPMREVALEMVTTTMSLVDRQASVITHLASHVEGLVRAVAEMANALPQQPELVLEVTRAVDE